MKMNRIQRYRQTRIGESVAGSEYSTVAILPLLKNRHKLCSMTTIHSSNIITSILFQRSEALQKSQSDLKTNALLSS